ncbi:hypothetical protein WDU94_009872, partial [Cyamophila willieti]
RSYLEGKRFILRTDSKAVTWFNKFKESKSKLVRWSILLQEFNFVIEHVPGTQNELPDAMSRSPVDEIAEESEIENWDIMVPPWLYYSKSVPESNEIALKSLELSTDRLIVPTTMIENIIKMHHDDELNNHPGTNETIRRVGKKYTWKGMHQDIREYVRKCEICAQVKTAGRTMKSGLTPRKLVHPFHTVSIDLMGPYTRSRKGKKFLLVATDTFSKWTEAYAMNTATSVKIVALLEQELFARFGYPKILISDNGPQFVSKVMKDACKRWKVTHHTTAIYTPRQSPVERQNQIIKNKLRIFLVEENHNRWDEKLDKILFSMRNSTNEGTKHSPASVPFGRNLRHPDDFCDEETSPAIYAEERVEKAAETNTLVRKNAEQYQKGYTKKTIVTLSAGQEVLIKTNILSSAAEGVTASLCPKWTGPFVIEEKLGENIYLCKNVIDPKDTRKVDISNIQIKK